MSAPTPVAHKPKITLKAKPEEAYVHIRSVPNDEEDGTQRVKSPQFATMGLVTLSELAYIKSQLEDSDEELGEYLDQYNQGVRLELVKETTDPEAILILVSFHGKRCRVGHIDLINHFLLDLGDDDQPLHADDFYYGGIPNEVTRDQFLQLMVDGLVKYKLHHPTAFDEVHARAEFERERLENPNSRYIGFTDDLFSSRGQIVSLLDRWIEHLSVRKTDHFPQWLQSLLEENNSSDEKIYDEIVDLALNKLNL